MAKGLKLKVRKFWELFPTFVEVTGEKLGGGGGGGVPIHILNRVKNPVKHLSEYSFLWKTVNYFCKKLHYRSLTWVLNAPLEHLKLNVI